MAPWKRSGAFSVTLWRAVDQNGVVLDILVQDRRDAKAARWFFKRLLRGLQYVPRVIISDFVPGNKIVVIYPAPLCGRGRWFDGFRGWSADVGLLPGGASAGCR
jgi:hypothetical protein